VNAGAGAGTSRAESEEKSHAPKDWTLKALTELRDGMKDLNIFRFTLPGKCHIDQVDNPQIYTYLAQRVNAAETGMSGQVNGQAVVRKIRQLQTRYTASEKGFQDWLSALQCHVDLAGR
jgi:hypothetical protein